MAGKNSEVFKHGTCFKDQEDKRNGGNSIELRGEYRGTQSAPEDKWNSSSITGHEEIMRHLLLCASWSLW
jgi:hypothetical protein